MPKFIIQDEYYQQIREQISPSVESILTALVREQLFLENDFTQRTAAIDQILQEIGKVITVTEAWQKMVNYSDKPEDHKKIIPKTLIDTFIKNFQLAKFDPISGFERGLRIHMGSETSRGYLNIFLMPVWMSDRGHGSDLENKIFKHTSDFFGIDADITASLISNADGSSKVRFKDASTVKVVVFSLSTLIDFLDGFQNGYANMQILFARESKGVKGKLNVVLRCVDDNNVILLSKGKVNGFYFDKGDLIPPPPSDTSKPVDDTSF